MRPGECGTELDGIQEGLDDMNNRWCRCTSLRLMSVIGVIGAIFFFQSLSSVRAAETSGEKPADNRPTVTSEESRVLDSARQAAQEGNLDEAVSILREADSDDSSAALPFTRAGYHQRAGDLEKAAGAYEEALRRMTHFDAARLNLAQVCMMREQYKRAGEQLIKLLDSRYEEKGRLWNLLGRCRLRQGRHVAAETAYRNSLAYEPNSAEARSGLMKAILEQGELQRARGLVKAELERDPLQAEMWKLLAQSHIEDGQTEKALRKLESARRLGVADKGMLTTLGDLLLRQDYPSAAVDTYRKAAALQNPPVGRLLDAAGALVSLGKPDEARTLLDDLAGEMDTLEPDRRVRVKLLRARIAEQQNDTDTALALYQEVLGRRPLNADALMSAGDVLRKKGKLEKALIYYERAGRAEGGFKAQSLVRQAQIAVRRRNYQDAVKLLEKSLDIERVDYVEDYLRQVREAAE